MTISPDAEKILEAIYILNGGASIVPENLDAAVSHILSDLGKDVMHDCIGLKPAEKRAYLLGYAMAVKINILPIGGK